MIWNFKSFNLFNKLNVWPHTVIKQEQNEKFYKNFVQFWLKIGKNKQKTYNLKKSTIF